MRYIFIGIIVFFVLLAIAAYYQTSGEQEGQVWTPEMLKQGVEREKITK